MSKLFVIEGKAENWQEALQLTANRLLEEGCVKDDFYECCKKREEEYPTGLTENCPVAIPHTDPKCIVKPFVACVRLKHPIPWREMAANEIIHQVKFAFMLGFQEADAGESHIELLQILVNNLQKVELMEKLDHANTVEEYWKLIISMDGLEDS